MLHRLPLADQYRAACFHLLSMSKVYGRYWLVIQNISSVFLNIWCDKCARQPSICLLEAYTISLYCLFPIWYWKFYAFLLQPSLFIANWMPIIEEQTVYQVKPCLLSLSRMCTCFSNNIFAVVRGFKPKAVDIILTNLYTLPIETGHWAHIFFSFVHNTRYADGNTCIIM